MILPQHLVAPGLWDAYSSEGVAVYDDQTYVACTTADISDRAKSRCVQHPSSIGVDRHAVSMPEAINRLRSAVDRMKLPQDTNPEYKSKVAERASIGSLMRERTRGRNANTGPLSYPDSSQFDQYSSNLPPRLSAELHAIDEVFEDSHASRTASNSSEIDVGNNTSHDTASLPGVARRGSISAVHLLGERAADWLSCVVRLKQGAVLLGGSGVEQGTRYNAKVLRSFAGGDGGSREQPIEDLLAAFWPVSGLAVHVWANYSKGKPSNRELIELVRLASPAPVVLAAVESLRYCPRYPFGRDLPNKINWGRSIISVSVVDMWQQLPCPS